MRSRTLTTLLALAALVASFAMNPVLTSAETGPTIEVNGRLLQGVSAVIENGSTLIPLRAVSDALGARVRWSPDAEAAELTLGADRVHVFLNAPFATVNGEFQPLPAPPKVINGSSYVPVRFMAEAFGATVGWDPNIRRVKVQMPKPVQVAPGATVAAPKRQILLLPVYIPVSSIEPETAYDPTWKLQRDPFAIELQGHLEAALAKAPGIELIPSAKLVPLVPPDSPLLTFVKGQDRDALYLGPLVEEMGADCFIPAYAFWGKTPAGKYNATLDFYLECGSDYSDEVRLSVTEQESSAGAAAALATQLKEWVATAFGETSENFAASEVRRAVSGAEWIINLGGDLTEAAQLLDEVRATGMGDPEWLTLRARLYLKANDRAEAIPLLQQATALLPEPEAAHYLLAGAYLDEHDAQAAQPLLEHLHRSSSPASTAYSREMVMVRTALARIYLFQERYAEAAQVTDALVAMGVDLSMDAYYSAFRVGVQLNRVKEIVFPLAEMMAISERRQVDDSPWVPSIRFRTIMLGGYLGPDVYDGLGQAKADIQDIPGAERAYRTAIEKEPTLFEAYRELRSLLHSDSRHAEALALYQAAEQQAAQHPGWLGHFRYGQGVALAALGRTQEAITAFQAAAAADPSKAEKVARAIEAVQTQSTGAGAAKMTLSQLAGGYPAHQGAFVQVEGTVRQLLDPYTLQLGTGRSTIVVRSDARLTVMPGNYVAVTGTVSGEVHGYNLLGAPITLGQVVSATVQKSGFLEVELDYIP